jgi:type II secretory pathway pseudopilin PulG
MGGQVPQRPEHQDGYSVVELLVAVTVFALVFAAVSIGIGRALEVNRGNRNRSAAAYLAARQLEEVRAEAFSSVDLGSTTCVYTTSSCNLPAPYTVVQDVAWTSPGSTTTSCGVPASSGSALAYKRVTVTVTWTDMGGVAPVTSQTLLTPPGGTYDPNDGHIVVQAFDRDALPLAGQTVSLSGPETPPSLTTDSDGCAFFAYLDPGTYTVTLPSSTYVDLQGNRPASQTAGVTASQITRVQFDYDQAATLSIGLTTPSGAVAAIPSGIAMTVANTKLTVGTKSFPEASTGSGTTRTVTPLFPYASGYQVWAGDCADADPQFFTGGSRGAFLATNRGATTSGSAALDAIDVSVTSGGSSGSALKNTTVSVQAIHGGTATAGCTGGETLTSSIKTDGSGKLRIAVPYGTWSVKVTSGTKSATSASTLVSPVVAAVPSVTVALP